MLGIHLFLLLVPTVVYSCSSDRLYFGTLNETIPEHIHRNGIYIRQQSNFRGYPVYKHELRDEYLYYLHGNLFGGYWAIGPNIGGTNAAISVQTQADHPEDASEPWHVWRNNSGVWIPAGSASMTCVSETFMTCTSGEIEISGLSGKEETQADRMGVYSLTNRTHELRPVYEREHPTREGMEFLFYQRGIWIIGPTVGTITGGLFTRDESWRPEYIHSPWIVFTGRYFKQVSSITVQCKDYTKQTEAPASVAENWLRTMVAELRMDVPVNHHPGRTNSSIGAIQEETSSEEEEEQEEEGEQFAAHHHSAAPAEGIDVAEEPVIDACHPNPCLNGGQCRLRGVNAYICSCATGFFGPNCGRELLCGPPPNPQNPLLLGNTGTAFMDTAFYMCHDQVLGGSQGIICQMNGQWTAPPTCINHVYTPTVGFLQNIRKSGSRRTSTGEREEPMDLVSVLDDLSHRQSERD